MDSLFYKQNYDHHDSCQTGWCYDEKHIIDIYNNVAKEAKARPEFSITLIKLNFQIVSKNYHKIEIYLNQSANIFWL